MSQSQENLWADGRRDRQTIFYMTLSAETRGTATSLQQLTAGNTPNLVKDNGKIFSKNSTTQENITILRLK